MESRRGYFVFCLWAFLFLSPKISTAYITIYEDAEFQGMFRTVPHFRQCLNFMNAWQDRASSINTHGNCLILCEHRDCKGRCERFEPGTWRHNHFGALDFNDKASSYKDCE